MALPVEELTLKQLQQFHNIDRMAYSRLVLTLRFDPFPSMKIVAFWNFLERIGFKHFVHNLLHFSDRMIFSLAKVTLVCLECLFCAPQEIFPWVHLDFPEMNKLVGQEILLSFLFKNREAVEGMIEDFVKDVCQVAFMDIVEGNLGCKPSSNPDSELDSPTSDDGGDNRELFTDDGKARVDSEDRSLFMTFSRGHPVSNQELHGFIVGKYGKCVEAIYMDKNPSHFDFSRILGGQKLVKLFINGKQVRVRRFVPKCRK
ncbi:hypothetical protein ES319_A07G126200v1 [Gossypium barbadense]|uniref:Uncharacterized protein n=2 Tax=Gossypium TaxID=3633 RepID=A0A5J5V304_GOSBA|nr:hypothetical protein ES319_A07G126200v1 [Gossypium barbadense]TYI19021.1 hypothetical protein ES332_A07G134900v1 [Gossypium tomentosum]